MLLRPKMVRSRGNGDEGVKIIVPHLVFFALPVILLHLWKRAEFLLFRMLFLLAGRSGFLLISFLKGLIKGHQDPMNFRIGF